MPGELPLVLLALIGDRPQGGYELLGELGTLRSRLPAVARQRLPSALRPASRAARRAGDRAADEGRLPGHCSGAAHARRTARTSSPGSRPGRAPCSKPDTSLQPTLARFAARISKLSGRVDRAAVERILDTAAKAIADLEVSNGQ